MNNSLMMSHGLITGKSQKQDFKIEGVFEDEEEKNIEDFGE